MSPSQMTKKTTKKKKNDNDSLYYYYCWSCKSFNTPFPPPPQHHYYHHHHDTNDIICGYRLPTWPQFVDIIRTRIYPNCSCGNTSIKDGRVDSYCNKIWISFIYPTVSHHRNNN